MSEPVRNFFQEWEYQWSIVHQLMTASPEEQQDQIFTFSQHISWATPLHVIIPNVTSILSMEHKFLNSFDAPEEYKKRLIPIMQHVKALNQVLDKMEDESEKAKLVLKRMDTGGKPFQECNKLLLISHRIYQFIADMVRTYTKGEKDIDSAIVSPQAKNQLDIQSVNPKEKQQTINDILDQFSRGEISKDQMELRMKEFAMKNVMRTITSHIDLN